MLSHGKINQKVVFETFLKKIDLVFDTSRKSRFKSINNIIKS
jgi:hypothetical protein